MNAIVRRTLCCLAALDLNREEAKWWFKQRTAGLSGEFHASKRELRDRRIEKKKPLW